MDYKLIPLISIFLLLFHGFSLILYKRKSRVYRNNMILSFLLLVMNGYSLFSVVNKGSYVFNLGHYVQPFGVAFHVGSVEALIVAVFSLIYFAISWFSVNNLKNEIVEGKIAIFYTLSSLLMASMFGIVYSYDIFTCFVFLEVNTLASCGLIAIKDKKENIKATLKYMILSSLSSGLILLGIGFIYAITGHLSMPFIHEALKQVFDGHQNTIFTSLTLLTFGSSIKAALFPLHVWLPDAHTVAPTVTSAILSSIVIKAPVIFMLKIFYYVFGADLLYASKILPLLLVMGAIAMIFGSLFARNQSEIKRMIAYSSVAQMGYIFLGIGMGTPLGLIMAVYQIIAHGITKATIFLSAGLIIEKSGFKTIEEIRGIGKSMPLTLGVFTICSLSMVGIPVLPGFINKWNLAIAAIQINHVGLLIIILMSSLLNATYYFPIIINGYFGESVFNTSYFKTKKMNVNELLPLMLLAVSVLAIGVFSGSIIRIIELNLFS